MGNKNKIKSSTNSISIDKNVEIVRLNIMIKIQTSTLPLLHVCFQ